MKTVSRLMIALVVVALAAATAYGVGLTGRPASGSPDAKPSSTPSSVAAAPATGATSTPPPGPTTAPTTAPTTTPTTAPTTAPPTPSPTRTPTRAPSPNPSSSPAAPMTPGRELLGPGDEGDQVRDLQARLRQIDWFDADVTGYYGDVTETAVRGFQA